MTATMTIRRFPRRGLASIPRRGVSGILSVLGGGTVNEAPASVTGQPWYIPDLFYNLQNKLSPDQAYALNNPANNAAIIQAETSPVTGQIVPAAQAYANSTANLPAVAGQSAIQQSTGSSIADTFDSLFSSIFGTGTPSTSDSGFPWSTVLLVAAAAGGGYLLYKVIAR